MLRRVLASIAAIAALAFTASGVIAQSDPGDVVRDYLGAWNEHNIDKAGGHFTDDVVYFDASVGTPVAGKEAATREVVGSFINAVPDLSWEMLGDLIVDDDMVAFQWKFSGTNTGAWADGTEPANMPFSFVGASVFQVVDGKIKTQSDYYDALGFYTQLGWITQ